MITAIKLQPSFFKTSISDTGPFARGKFFQNHLENENAWKTNLVIRVSFYQLAKNVKK